MIEIKIQTEIFDISTEMAKFSGLNANGATVSFLGSVRDLKFEDLKTLEIEHFHKMAEKVLYETAKHAYKKWSLSNCIIIHRYGKLRINDPIVLIITSSDHRKDAFKASEHIIDFLKTNAPFWKKETTEKNSYWVSQKK
tara:strand:+ start:1111 stop:1527 length:417 start_codon:yes stop_codon:yes gene_type:complete